MQKGSGYIQISISSQTLSVSPSKNDLVDLWPKFWCNNSRATFFLGANFFVFDISSIPPQNACFLSALCDNVTEFFYFAPKNTVQNSFCNKQVCPKFINVLIETIISHKSGAKITLYNVAMKGSPLLSHIFISAGPFCFAVTWCLSAA